jgi:hypothetical protein
VIEDQPPPVPSDRRPVWELVIADMQERDQVGRARYGTPLQPFNGRDPLIDAYQEALDLVVYLRQAIEERDPPIGILVPPPVWTAPARGHRPGAVARVGRDAERGEGAGRRGARSTASTPPLDGLIFHPRYSLGSEPGWPDLTLVRRRDRRLIFAELKSREGRRVAAPGRGPRAASALR